MQFRWFTAALVVLLGFVAYANTFAGGFVWDDASSILLHKHVQDPAKIGQLFKEDLHAFGRGQGNFYRPLLAVSFMADYAWAFDGRTEDGLPDPAVFPFHLTNTFLHVGTALWLLALLCRLGAPRFVCAAVPLVWVVHPLHTEAVAYISGRGDSMAAFFMFAALWFALWEGNARKRIAGIALSVVFFIAGILSKESALILPFLFVPLLLWTPRSDGTRPAGRDRLNRIPALGGMLVALGAYAYLRTTVLQFGSDSQGPVSGLGTRLIETGQALALYIKLIFVPTGLHMERTLQGVPAWLGMLGLALAVALAAVSVLAAYTGHRRIAMAGAWFLITWFPISGIIPLNAPMAEHWLYVPLAGSLWMLFEFAILLIPQKSAPYVLYPAVCAACLALLGLTVARNSDWRSNEALYVATLEENPRSIRVHYNLAATYQDLLDNPAGARRHFERVIELYQKKKVTEGLDENLFWDDELEAQLSLGDILCEVRPGEAMEHYAKVLSIKPEGNKAALVGMAAFGAGRCSLQMGQVAQAEQMFKRAVELLPELQPQVERLLSRSG